MIRDRRNQDQDPNATLKALERIGCELLPDPTTSTSAIPGQLPERNAYRTYVESLDSEKSQRTMAYLLDRMAGMI